MFLKEFSLPIILTEFSLLTYFLIIFHLYILNGVLIFIDNQNSTQTLSLKLRNLFRKEYRSGWKNFPYNQDSIWFSKSIGLQKKFFENKTRWYFEGKGTKCFFRHWCRFSVSNLKFLKLQISFLTAIKNIVFTYKLVMV